MNKLSMHDVEMLEREMLNTDVFKLVRLIQAAKKLRAVQFVREQVRGSASRQEFRDAIQLLDEAHEGLTDAALMFENT